MEQFLFWFSALVILGLVGVLGVIVILLLANLGAFFTKIPQGSTVFIAAGDKLKAIWPNVGGHRMSNKEDADGRRWLVPETDKKEITKSFFSQAMLGTVWFQRWLWNTFGVRFVSWVWPHTDVYQFDLRKGGRRRVEAHTQAKAEAPLRSRMVDSPEGEKGKGTVVDSLLFLVPRPVYVEGVELAGDNSRINLLLLPVFQQVIPVLPAFYLKGDFFTSLDAAVEASVVDFFATHRVAVYTDEKREGQFAGDSLESVDQSERGNCKKVPLTYEHWLRLAKAGGSRLELHLRTLNIGKEYYNWLAKDANNQELLSCISGLTPDKPESSNPDAAPTPRGIIPRFGFGLVSFRLVEWEAHGETGNLAKALLAKETERHTAEGVRQKAAGERDALVARAEGESSRYDQLLKALTDKEVTPNVAAAVLATQVRTENIRHAGLGTYVEGGASASLLISPTTQPKP